MMESNTQMLTSVCQWGSTISTKASQFSSLGRSSGLTLVTARFGSVLGRLARSLALLFR